MTGGKTVRPFKLQNPFSSLTESLQHHKAAVLAVFLLLLSLASLRFYSLNLDTSLVSLFPDSSAKLAQTGRLLEFNPGARIMLVELRSENGGQIDVMRELAGKIRAAMGESLHQDSRPDTPDGLPEPASLLRLLPGLFDAELEAALQAKLRPQAMERKLLELRHGLSGPLAFMPKRYLRDDPLGLIPELTQRLSAAGSGDGVFFEATGGAGYPVSDDGRRLLMLLQPETGINDVYGAKKFIAKLDATIDEALSHEPGISVQTAGGLRFTAENTATIERDLKLTVSLSLLLIALIYLLTVRSFGAIWLFLTPVAAVIFSGGAMSFIWPATAGLALGFGAAVLGLAEDYAVLVHFALRKNPGQKAKALGLLARPMIFSAGLCISSFCVLMLSSIPALRQLGFFAAFSLLGGLAVALLVLPCCPWIDRPIIRPKEPEALPRLRLNPRPIPTFLLAAFCLLVCFLGLEQITFDPSFQNMGANSARLQRELMELRAGWQSSRQPEREPEIWASSGADLEQALENAAALAAALRAKNAEAGARAGQIFSLADVLPPLAVQRENIKRWNVFVRKNAGALTQTMQDASLASGFKPESFAGFTAWFAQSETTADGAITLESLRQAGFAELLWWTLIEKNGQWHALTIGNTPAAGPEQADIPEGSVLLSSAAVAEGLNKAFEREKFLLPLAGLVCLLLLALCFKKPALILLACLPPLFGLASVLTWLALSSSPLTLAGAAALILVIGLGADYGIVMLHELSSELSLGAFKSILVSGLTTLAGLGVLLLARHPVLHALGSITFFGLVAEMTAVLLIVPFLCSKKITRRNNFNNWR